MNSQKTVVFTEKGPKPIGPFSQAIKANGMVFVSGQIGVVPETGEFAASDVVGQAEQVLKNIRVVLEAADSSLDHVVKVTVLIRDMNDFTKMNEVYMKYFTQDFPARTTFAVAGLPRNALVEMECIAMQANL
eukprot:CAMPEP_0168546616 /NCGR_PEP_ID=MMETSP0413-20121227/3594_1 /TAXON_ID=136452 /ORGANISM="Filamoeba nolandi, Strain NC-AS-23-1" /LENGTH=131 /DNA_ID=CAMNT_0008576807 /DNA_START=38 /DNA_END=433 /DNA_ORIENTATION=-